MQSPPAHTKLYDVIIGLDAEQLAGGSLLMWPENSHEQVVRRCSSGGHEIHNVENSLSNRLCLLACRHNGEYVQTHGYLEDIMADKLTSYLDDQAAEGEPFFVYYATHSIHT